MSNEQKALVARLRSVDISWSETGEWCAEAADLIEAQAAEIARLRDAWEAKIARLGKEAEAQAAEIECLREAKWIARHNDTINDMVLMGMARDVAIAERNAQAAENARLRERLTQAIERLRDMLQADDGQAWAEAQRFVDIIAQEHLT